MRSPLLGKIDRLLGAKGSNLPKGDAVLTIKSDEQSIWEALRGLSVVGQEEELPLIERYSSGAEPANDRIKQQAVLTANAIKSHANPGTKQLSNRGSRREVRQRNSVYRFPVVGRHHFDCVPRAAVKECAIWSFADAFLTANAEIGIYFDAPEWWMIFVRYPEHAGFDRTVFDASRGARATGATVGGDREDSRSLFACRLAVTL
jgi:hypothetical protein